MSTFKKVISIVLCIALFAGSFTFLGGLIVPKASAAVGTTNISKTYAELEKEYDNFFYIGADVYEVANGELTDGYVNAGDWLEYRLTLLSDRYIALAYPCFIYENDFFDVRVVSSTTAAAADSTTYDNAVTKDYVNKDHPMGQVGTKYLQITLTSLQCSTLAAFNGGYSELDDYENWDQVKPLFEIDTNVSPDALVMKDDNWVLKWYVRVRDDVKENDTGVSKSHYGTYKLKFDATTGQPVKPLSTVARRTSDIPSYAWQDTNPGASTCKGLTTKKAEIEWLFLEDTVHTFICGENPADSAAPVEKKTATFLENDGTQISALEYAPDEAVEIPAAVENQYGWADVTDANSLTYGEVTTDLTGLTMAQKNITYKRVLTTDKFDITVNVDGGTVDADKLPEGTTANADGSITVKAPINTDIDLNTAVPTDALFKAGYAASWDPSTVKIENIITGATAKVVWTPEKYEATFYLDKAALDSGEALGTVSDVAYDARISYSAIKDVEYKDENGVPLKFAGWMDKDGNEVSTGDTISKYTYTENMSFYAKWNPYKYSTSVMVRDYENGGWKILETKYADNGTLALSAIQTMVENAGYIYVGVSDSGDAYNKLSAAIPYDAATKQVYAYTKTEIDVTWQVPVVDEETGLLTEEFTTDNAKYATQPFTDAYSAKEVKTTLTTTAPTGYKFLGWFDEDGNEVAYGATGATLNTADGLERVITAKYELVEYSVAFQLRSGTSDVLNMSGKYTIGSELNFAEATFISKNTEKESELPTIGLENSKQPNGGYALLDGYKFMGWYLGKDTVNEKELNVENTLTLTADIIKTYASGSSITVMGNWEGEYYELVIYYQSGDSTEEVAMEPIMVQTGAKLDEHLNNAKAIVNANLPEGKTFNSWKYDGEETTVNYMPAYGATFRAQYTSNPIVVYIDYNNGTEENPLTLAETMQKYSGQNCYYGLDLNEVPPVSTSNPNPQSFTGAVRNMTITKKPGETYECVDWVIYHVPAGKDVYTREDWVEGANDDGTSIAKTTLVYQAQWKEHGEFFFRINDTSGAISRALGKNFKMYYWYNGYPRDKETGSDINLDPEFNVILFYQITVENWDWSRFFDIEMWQSLTLCIDPYEINKSALNPANFIKLLQALFQGLGNGFEGEGDSII